MDRGVQIPRYYTCIIIFVGANFVCSCFIIQSYFKKCSLSCLYICKSDEITSTANKKYSHQKSLYYISILLEKIITQSIYISSATVATAASKPNVFMLPVQFMTIPTHLQASRIVPV